MGLKSLIEKYDSRYRISYIDLADAGESNRIIVHIVSIILFFFSLIFVCLNLITFYPDFSERTSSLVYYGVFFVLSIYAFLATRQKKEIERSKSYIKKTIPLYVMMLVTFSEATFTVLEGWYFDGFVTFCITAVIGLCTASISPIVFLVGISITIGFMTPTMYQNQGLTGAANVILISVLIYFQVSVFL